jgi:hypothetical protein
MEKKGLRIALIFSFLSANVRECAPYMALRIRADGYVLFVTPMALIRAIRGPKFLSC